MNYLGEFSKNSTILLELVTKDENNMSVPVDFPPTAVIERYDSNGVTEVLNVTLDTVDNGARHTYLLTIPTDWHYGNYRITYSVFIDGDMYSTKESFEVDKTDDLGESNQELNFHIIDLLNGQEVFAAEVQDEFSAMESDYALPPDFQLDAELLVIDNKIIIRPKEPLKVNHSYMVVLDKTIASLSGRTLQAKKVVTFTTEYKPLYATPLEVRSVLKGTFSQFTRHEIYVALRDAGQKAHTLLRTIADAENNRFRELTDRDDQFFPAQKFVLYEASRQLVSSLIIKILHGEDGLSTTSGGSIKLGDFALEGDSSSTASGQQPEIGVINSILKEIEKELKFWTDSLMGRNARGYAKAISAITRNNTVGPTSRDF